MKSKSFDLKKSSGERDKRNNSFDFGGLYKSTAESNVRLLEKPKLLENLNKENSFTNSGTGNRDGSPNKKKKKGRNEPLDISLINIDGHSLAASGRNSPVHDSRTTSTPNVSRKTNSGQSKVKSIMKTSNLTTDDAMDDSVSIAQTPSSKSKKRNKSVSFMLDDTEEIAIKKTKSNDSVKVDKKAEKKKLKKLRKNLSEKENESNVRVEPATEAQNKKLKPKVVQNTTQDATGDSTPDVQSSDKKKKFKKIKKRKGEQYSELAENDSNNNEESNENKPKKVKKKKHVKTANTSESEGEPAKKLKKEVKPDIIAEDLENLSIGDNAHTLTNLLDEMTVVDSEKKRNKNKLHRKKTKEQKTASTSSSETVDLEKIEEGKEKVKWKKRKWNKDKKGDLDDDIVATSVVIDNLPLKIVCSYKKILADHFGACGLIKRVGIAEVYPTEQPKPVFTTTIVFCSEEAVNKALEEDNTSLEGSRIRVKRALGRAHTTLVARSYAALSDQALSSAFSAAGRIRAIKHLVKGKKSMATAFIEFDGPEAVERAIKMAEDVKIGAKKIHVSKYEVRGTKRKVQKIKSQRGSDNEGDSEDSNE